MEDSDYKLFALIFLFDFHSNRILGAFFIMSTENKFISEDNLLLMLSCSKGTLRDYLKKELFTRYEIGNKYFYKIEEVNDFIESTKKKERNKLALERYIDFPKDKSKEKTFLFENSKHLLRLVHELDFNFIDERHLTITRLLFQSYGDIEYVALQNGISKTRVMQIVNKTISRIYVRCSFMKKNYENFERILAENEKLILENRAIWKLIETKITVEDISYHTLGIELHDLDLSVRAFNCLSAARINTIGELLSFSSNDLLRYRNFGRKSLIEIEKVLANKGFKLKNN